MKVPGREAVAVEAKAEMLANTRASDVLWLEGGVAVVRKRSAETAAVKVVSDGGTSDQSIPMLSMVKVAVEPGGFVFPQDQTRLV